MAKSTSTKKATPKNASKTNAAFSEKTKTPLKASKDNASKYQPTKDANMNVQSLEPQDGLAKLFVDSIKDIYWAENHLVKALPKMINAAGSSSLKKAIANHLKETKTHVERLGQVFELLGKKAQAKKCDAMEGLAKEGEGVVEDTDAGSPARDLAIIMASQKVEHYEISAYTGLIKLAGRLGLNDVEDLLSKTLDEEIKSDELLGRIADNDISF
jgi:ferritin-like metal-binding protein YciE